jgi:hypothetical protein
MPTCETCRFWNTPDKDHRAAPGPRQRCHRRAPVVVVVPQPYGPDKPTAMFPFTAREDWCGDYAPDAEAEVRAA